MPTAAWRLLFLPFILLAFLLVGTPDFPAFDRAVQKAFTSRATPRRPTTSLPAEASAQAGVVAPDALRGRNRTFAGAGLSRAAGATLHVPCRAASARRTFTVRALAAGATEVRVKSRRAAIPMMAAPNSAYTAIVAHNYTAARP